MTALYIISGIIFVIWLLLFQFVTVDFSFLDAKLRYKIKYMFFTVLDSEKQKKDKPGKAKKNSIKKSDKKPKEDEIRQQKEAAKENTQAPQSHKYTKRKEKESEKVLEEKGEKAKKQKKHKKSIEDRLFEIGEKLDFFKKLVEMGKRPVLKILRGIHLTDVFIDFDVADEDAYDAAIKFGRMNAVVFNALSALACLFTVKKKSVNIHCVYNSSESKYDISFNIRLRPSTVIAAAFDFGFKYLMYFIIKPKLMQLKNKIKKNKEASAPAVQ